MAGNGTYEQEFTESDLEDLKAAKAILENPSLTAQISDAIGTPVEKVFDYVPEKLKDKVGDITHQALLQGLNIAVASLRETEHRSPPEVQGNGAVMRAAAHGVKARDTEEAAENAGREAALTHPSWEARASSALVAAFVALLIDGREPEDALDASYALVEGRDEPGKRVREALRPLEGYEHNPSGWTVYTTRLALLGLLDAPDFCSGLEDVIRLGETRTRMARSPGRSTGPALVSTASLPSGYAS